MRSTPRPPEVAQQRLDSRPQLVAQEEYACQPAVYSDRDRGGAGPTLHAGFRPVRRGKLARDEAQPSHDQMMAVHVPFDAFARRFDHVGGERERKAALSRLLDDGLRDDVLRCLVERSGKP